MKATGRKSGFYSNLLLLQISKREPQVGTMVWPFSSNSVKVEKLVSFISYLRKCDERERSQCLKTRKYNERERSQCLHLGGAGDGEVWLWVRPLQRAWDDNRLPGLRKTLYNCKSMFDLSRLNPLVKSCDQSKFQADPDCNYTVTLQSYIEKILGSTMTYHLSHHMATVSLP